MEKNEEDGKLRPMAAYIIFEYAKDQKSCLERSEIKWLDSNLIMKASDEPNELILSKPINSPNWQKILFSSIILFTTLGLGITLI